jgi:hypothetical protein
MMEPDIEAVLEIVIDVLTAAVSQPPRSPASRRAAGGAKRASMP